MFHFCLISLSWNCALLARVLTKFTLWYSFLHSLIQQASVVHWGFPGGSDGKESACNAGDLGFIPGDRNGYPLQLFLFEEFHRQRSLAGDRLWDCKRVGYDWATSTFTFSLYYVLCTTIGMKASSFCPVLGQNQSHDLGIRDGKIIFNDH